MRVSVRSEMSIKDASKGEFKSQTDQPPVPERPWRRIEKRWYKWTMKEKTAVTLSSAILNEVDETAGSKGSRSAFIEEFLREYFKEKVRESINQRDAAIVNANADYLNREMEDALSCQAPIEWTTEDDSSIHAPRRTLSCASASGGAPRAQGICDP